MLAPSLSSRDVLRRMEPIAGSSTKVCADLVRKGADVRHRDLHAYLSDPELYTNDLEHFKNDPEHLNPDNFFKPAQQHSQASSSLHDHILQPREGLCESGERVDIILEFPRTAVDW